MNYRDFVTTEWCKEHFYYENGKLFWKKKTSPLSRIEIGSEAGYIRDIGGLEGHGDKKPYKLLGIRLKGKKTHIPIPSIIWIYHGGILRPKEMIDHINGDTLDNHIENLRVATNQQNGCNRGKQKNNTSGFKGVYRNKKGGWEAKICIKSQGEHGKSKTHNIYLGYFQDKTKAAKAYDMAAKEWFGKFAFLNFPEEKLMSKYRFITMEKLREKGYLKRKKSIKGPLFTMDIWYKGSTWFHVPQNKYGEKATKEEVFLINNYYDERVLKEDK